MFDIFEWRNKSIIFSGVSDENVDPPFDLRIAQYVDNGHIIVGQKFAGASQWNYVVFSRDDWKQLIELIEPHLSA